MIINVIIVYGAGVVCGAGSDDSVRRDQRSSSWPVHSWNYISMV